VAKHVQGRALVRDLQRCGNGLMLRPHRLVAPSRRPEQRLELGREHRAQLRLAILPDHLNAVGPVPEVREVQLETAIVAQVHERFDLANVARLAVRAEAHDLELVAVVRKPEVLRDRQVEQAERVRKEHVAVDRHAWAGDAAPRGADEVAEPVDRADRRFV
jgi:hypothetical protein